MDSHSYPNLTPATCSNGDHPHSNFKPLIDTTRISIIPTVRKTKMTN